MIDRAQQSPRLYSLKPRKEGYIRMGAEYWRAKSNIFIEAGRMVKVVGKEGPVLIVEPKEES